MQRRPVSSSSLQSVGYDEQTQTLEIEFHSGAVYQYFRVPATVFSALLLADSKGRYFESQIRAVYQFVRVS
jgi:hypothetical protein